MNLAEKIIVGLAATIIFGGMAVGVIGVLALMIKDIGWLAGIATILVSVVFVSAFSICSDHNK